jgi:isopentenyl-diphosphate delta-isomerase
MDKIILVDKQNNEIGEGEKLEVHQKGLLHRAFSIFIFNNKKELLLQQRSKKKYHSGGLWSNTVCSHPRVGENYKDAIHRRLKEEMGFDSGMEEAGSFIYKANLDHGLTEHEYDTVFKGVYNGKIKPNPDEVMNYRWVSLNKLEKDLKENPNNYSAWFQKALNKINLKKI